ncbi:hypothetical protein BS50DRAFT_576707 [Corynespora cassiicola Philippines]|uniref:Uncharacterized protein n=1 Tax=Corynespora cassiicola Philippines TaxID=1448308 RepID=A0A2T2NFE0_CORCC|nr:hypothetical protein BS50DRAFT_576707 [Corynespora cassiicola Philippines]
MQQHMEDFCIAHPLNEAPDIEETFADDTYDGAWFSVKGEVGMNGDTCRKIFSQIIHGCVPNEDNPMNWKYGGEVKHVVDGKSTTYRINIAGPAVNRFTEGDDGKSPMSLSSVNCIMGGVAIRDLFSIRGRGWENGNYGEQLIRRIRECMKSNPTNWVFEYYDPPLEDGSEWVANGSSTIGQRWNCFAHSIRAAGGPQDAVCTDVHPCRFGYCPISDEL